jgi:hypothetical protein
LKLSQPSSALLKKVDSSYLRVDNLDPNLCNPYKSFSLIVEGGCPLPSGRFIHLFNLLKPSQPSLASLKKVDSFYLRVDNPNFWNTHNVTLRPIILQPHTTAEGYQLACSAFGHATILFF